MDEEVQLIVHRSCIIFDRIIVNSHSAFRYPIEKDDRRHELESDMLLNKKQNVKKNLIRLNHKGFNAYLVSVYVDSLLKSNTYRKAALKLLLQHVALQSFKPNYEIVLFVKLRTPKKQFLDYNWNEKIMRMVLEARELELTMSWLSTLGGAFSALGEEFHHCAQIAGKISVKQFELALRLGNPLLIARCKLYTALSMIQQGHFKTPRYMIESLYKFAIDQKDIRLQNMCQGVWAKLKYCYKLHKLRKLTLL